MYLLSEWIFWWSRGKVWLLQNYLGSSCDLEKADGLSQGHMIRKRVRDTEGTYRILFPLGASEHRSSHEGKVTGSGKFYTICPHFCLNGIPREPSSQKEYITTPARIRGATAMGPGVSPSPRESPATLSSAVSSPLSKTPNQNRMHAIWCHCSRRRFSARRHVIGGLSQNDILLSAARGCLSSLKHRAASREVPGPKISEESPQLGPGYCSVQVQRGKVWVTMIV